MSQGQIWILLALVFVFVSATTAIKVNNGVCLYRKWERPGDIKFLVIAGIRERNQNGSCGGYSQMVFDQVVAMDWIVSMLKGNGSRADAFIPGVTIGYDLYDNCDNEDLTTDLIFSGIMSGQNMNCTPDSSDSPVYIGAISLTTPSATNIIARLLNPLPVFRPLVSSPVLNTHDRQNLLQSVVSFHEEANAITKMLLSNEWNFIVVLHTDDALEEAIEFTAIARSNGICVDFTGAPDSTTKDKIFNVMNQALGKSIAVVYFGSSSGAENIIGLSKSSRPHDSKIHWVFTSNVANDSRIEENVYEDDSVITINLHNSKNMEFITYYSKLVQTPSHSPLQGLIKTVNFSNNAGPEKHPFPMVHAIIAVINSTKKIWDASCNQQDSVSDCLAFQTAIQDMLTDEIKDGVHVLENIESRFLPKFYKGTLQYLQDGSQKYDTLYLNMYKRNQVTTLGKYTDNEYTAEANVVQLPTSVCRHTCKTCQDQLNLRYSYFHGDILILGLFSLRQYGDSPYSCGHIRRGTHDIITVSSFIQSVKVRRNETGMNFGAIAIDDCYNELNTSHYLVELFSKSKIIRDPEHPSRVIDFDNVISIVGALSSSVTLILADLSTAIKMPIISYGATSPDLDNRNRYPYFLRTVPSDTLQVQGMVAVVLELGVSHVGLVYIDDAYGQGGKIRLQEEAYSRNICVKEPISVTQNMNDEFVEDVIEKLYYQEVRVVLLFAIDSVAQQLLDVIDKKFSVKYPKLVFISSEGWGSNRHLLNRASLGSIVFNIATQAYNNEQYTAYLQSLRPFKANENRWIPRYFEDYNQCDYMTSFEKTFFENNEPKLCDKNSKTIFDINTTKSLSEDQRYVHTMLSVFAVTEGYKLVCEKEKTCSPDALRTHPDTFFSHIKNSRYTNNRLIFDEDGNGHIGYTLHNIQMVDVGLSIEYKQIGTYQTDGKLNLTQQPKFYNDRRQEISLQEEYAMEINCFSYSQTCLAICPSQETTTTIKISTEETIVKANEKDSSLMALTIVFGVFMGILLVALIAVVVMLFRILSRQTKQISERGESGGHTTSMSDVHSIYDEPGTHTPSAVSGMMVGGSVSSLNVQQPVQYAHIRQMSNPDISFHHVRQISNHELRSHWFSSLERPASTLSAPSYKPNSNQKSPFLKRIMQPTADKQKPYKQTYSPKTPYPHSAPSDTKKPVVYRPRAQSSPRFRYPSTISDDETHYTMPTLESQENLAPQRKLGISDDDTQEQLNDVHDQRNVCNSKGNLYLDPGEEFAIPSNSEAKITYLTAKDLVTSDDDDEKEDDVSSKTVGPIQSFGAESRAVAPPQESSTGMHMSVRPEHISNVTSPTDKEVMSINFPPLDDPFQPIGPNTSRDKNDYKTNTQPKRRTINESDLHSGEKDSERQAVSVQTVVYQKSSLRSSISDVPDIIKHGAYEEDGVFII